MKREKTENLKQLIVAKALFTLKHHFIDYGCNIEVGDNFYANYGCILDVNKVQIGNNVWVGGGAIIFRSKLE